MSKKKTPISKSRVVSRRSRTAVTPEMVNTVREDLQRVDRALFGNTKPIRGKDLEDGIRRSVDRILSGCSQ